MSLTMKQSLAIRQMAEVLYTFLPGSGDRRWIGHVNFASVSHQCGLGDYWPGGSKLPAIATLLERTLETRRDRFERLMLSIVRNGLTYRQKKGTPVRREEVEALNRLLLDLEFKFPQLWDIAFLGSLCQDRSDGDLPDQAEETISGSLRQSGRTIRLTEMRDRFYALSLQKDRQAAGLALERLLNDMFQCFDLEPRGGFQVVGEQIDGSVLLDHHIYIIEAKWTSEPVSESDLLVFRGKIEGKSALTRGFFISVNNFTDEAKEAIIRGKQATFFLVDGYDLAVILEGYRELPDVLRFKLRKLMEEGRVFASVREMP